MLQNRTSRKHKICQQELRACSSCSNSETVERIKKHNLTLRCQKGLQEPEETVKCLPQLKDTELAEDKPESIDVPARTQHVGERIGCKLYVVRFTQS